MKNYLTPEIDVRRGDVLSAWSGIRPLVKDPNAENTQSLGTYQIISLMIILVLPIYHKCLPTLFIKKYLLT